MRIQPLQYHTEVRKYRQTLLRMFPQQLQELLGNLKNPNKHISRLIPRWARPVVESERFPQCFNRGQVDVLIALIGTVLRYEAAEFDKRVVLW